MNATKLNEDQFRYLEKCVKICKDEHPDWRIGQCWFNELFKFKSELADQIRGTVIDPFFTIDAKKIEIFKNYIQEDTMSKKSNLTANFKISYGFDERIEIDALIADLYKLKDILTKFDQPAQIIFDSETIDDAGEIVISNFID